MGNFFAYGEPSEKTGINQVREKLNEYGIKQVAKEAYEKPVIISSFR